MLSRIKIMVYLNPLTNQADTRALMIIAFELGGGPHLSRNMLQNNICCLNTVNPLKLNSKSSFITVISTAVENSGSVIKQ